VNMLLTTIHQFLDSSVLVLVQFPYYDLDSFSITHILVQFQFTFSLVSFLDSSIFSFG
jgi:hypothetical protein